MTASPFLLRMGLMLTGILAWGLQFGILYGLAALACAGRLPAVTAHWEAVAAAATGAALLATGAAAALAARSLRSERNAPAAFLAEMTLLIAGVSAVAIVWTALPVFLSPACHPPLGS